MGDVSIDPTQLYKISQIINKWSDISNQQFLVHENPQSGSVVLQNNILVDTTCIKLSYYQSVLINNYNFQNKTYLIPIFSNLFKYCILLFFITFNNYQDTVGGIDIYLTNVKSNIIYLLEAYNKQNQNFFDKQKTIAGSIEKEPINPSMTYKAAKDIRDKLHNVQNNWDIVISNINDIVVSLKNKSESLDDNDYLQHVKNSIYYPYLRMELLMGVQTITGGVLGELNNSYKNAGLLLQCIYTFINVLSFVKLQEVQPISQDNVNPKFNNNILIEILNMDDNNIDMNTLNKFSSGIYDVLLPDNTDNDPLLLMLNMCNDIFENVKSTITCVRNPKINNNNCIALTSGMSGTIKIFKETILPTEYDAVYTNSINILSICLPTNPQNQQANIDPISKNRTSSDDSINASIVSDGDDDLSTDTQSKHMGFSDSTISTSNSSGSQVHDDSSTTGATVSDGSMSNNDGSTTGTTVSDGSMSNNDGSTTGTTVSDGRRPSSDESAISGITDSVYGDVHVTPPMSSPYKNAAQGAISRDSSDENSQQIVRGKVVDDVNEDINKLKENFSKSFIQLITGLTKMIDKAKKSPDTENNNDDEIKQVISSFQDKITQLETDNANLLHEINELSHPKNKSQFVSPDGSSTTSNRDSDESTTTSISSISASTIPSSSNTISSDNSTASSMKPNRGSDESTTSTTSSISSISASTIPSSSNTISSDNSTVSSTEPNRGSDDSTIPSQSSSPPAPILGRNTNNNDLTTTIQKIKDKKEVKGGIKISINKLCEDITGSFEIIQENIQGFIKYDTPNIQSKFTQLSNRCEDLMDRIQDIMDKTIDSNNTVLKYQELNTQLKDLSDYLKQLLTSTPGDVINITDNMLNIITHKVDSISQIIVRSFPKSGGENKLRSITHKKRRMKRRVKTPTRKQKKHLRRKKYYK